MSDCRLRHHLHELARVPRTGPTRRESRDICPSRACRRHFDTAQGRGELVERRTAPPGAQRKAHVTAGASALLAFFVIVASFTIKEMSAQQLPTAIPQTKWASG